MKMQPNSWTIVLAGNWNAAIFTPDWLTRHFFESSEIKLQFSPVPGLPPRFTCLGIGLIPSFDRLIITVDSGAIDLFQRAEQRARSLLGLLPHTPLSGVGVNFEYVEETPEPELVTSLRPVDITSLAEHELVTASVSITRKLSYLDHILNLSTNFLEGKLVFSFNYHFDVSNASQASEVLADVVRRDFQHSLTVMHEVFHLDLEGA